MRFHTIIALLSALVFSSSALPTLSAEVRRSNRLTERRADYTDSVSLRAFVRALAASGASDDFKTMRRAVSMVNRKQRRSFEDPAPVARPQSSAPVIGLDSSSIFDVASSQPRPHYAHFHTVSQEHAASVTASHESHRAHVTPVPNLAQYKPITLTPVIEHEHGKAVVGYVPVVKPTPSPRSSAFVPMTVSSASPLAVPSAVTQQLGERDLAAEVAADAEAADEQEWEDCDIHPIGHPKHDPTCEPIPDESA